ncbi:MAG: enoyl-CoA hydratase/isomerase family protein, partial [Candidatus Rokuibacteriota bacterium]
SDVVIVRESARFGMPEPRIGFIPSQIVPFVVRRIGEGPARELAVTGRLIDADEALRLGIGRYLCANEADIARTLEAVLDDIRRNEPAAVAAVKALALSCATDSDPRVMDAAAAHLVRLLRGSAAQAGMQAFLDKRPAPWAPEADRRSRRAVE